MVLRTAGLTRQPRAAEREVLSADGPHGLTGADTKLHVQDTSCPQKPAGTCGVRGEPLGGVSRRTRAHGLAAEAQLSNLQPGFVSKVGHTHVRHLGTLSKGGTTKPELQLPTVPSPMALGPQCCSIKNSAVTVTCPAPPAGHLGDGRQAAFQAPRDKLQVRAHR